ncbi:type II toxin-antitoxin system death-on-curing family toxin [soil metagenome]
MYGNSSNYLSGYAFASAMDLHALSDWRFIGESVALAVHDRGLARHGGAEGLRDPGALQGALARPRQLAAYGEPDAADLAAAYAFGIAKAHAFVDGNKRTAWVVLRLFLADSGRHLAFERAEAVEAMVDLAAGTLPESDFAAGIRARLR